MIEEWNEVNIVAPKCVICSFKLIFNESLGHCKYWFLWWQLTSEMFSINRATTKTKNNLNDCANTNYIDTLPTLSIKVMNVRKIMSITNQVESLYDPHRGVTVSFKYVSLGFVFPSQCTEISDNDPQSKVVHEYIYKLGQKRNSITDLEIKSTFMDGNDVKNITISHRIIYFANKDGLLGNKPGLRSWMQAVPRWIVQDLVPNAYQ